MPSLFLPQKICPRVSAAGADSSFLTPRHLYRRSGGHVRPAMKPSTTPDSESQNRWRGRPSQLSPYDDVLGRSAQRSRRFGCRSPAGTLTLLRRMRGPYRMSFGVWESLPTSDLRVARRSCSRGSVPCTWTAEVLATSANQSAMSSATLQGVLEVFVAIALTIGTYSSTGKGTRRVMF
jgi:hypothetical protein